MSERKMTDAEVMAQAEELYSASLSLVTTIVDALNEADVPTGIPTLYALQLLTARIYVRLPFEVDEGMFEVFASLSHKIALAELEREGGAR